MPEDLMAGELPTYFFSGKFMAIRGKSFAESVAGTAACRILVTRTTGFSCLRGIRGQRDSGFRIGDRYCSTHRQRGNDSR
jgi:hypothetical protein